MKARWISLLGAALTIAALTFIGLRLWEDRGSLATWHPDSGDLLALVTATVTYLCAGMVLALAWVRLLHNDASAETDTRTLIGIYARSQLAKYVPGNVAHLAGRHVLGRREGYRHSVLAVSALLEVVLLLFVSTAIVMIGGLMPHLLLTHGGPDSLLWAMPVLAVASVVGMHLAFRWFWPLLRRRYPQLPHLNLNLARLLPVLAAYVVFFILGGVALKLIIGTLNYGGENLRFLSIVAIFALTWLIGFIAPGVPSGIGLREAALVLMLQPYMDSAWAVLAAVILRLVTVAGDVFLFCVGCILGRSIASR